MLYTLCICMGYSDICADFSRLFCLERIVEIKYTKQKLFYKKLSLKTL